MSELSQSINRSIHTYFYEVYYVDQETFGRLVDHKPTWEVERDFYAVYHFNGRTANYWIGTNERGLTRNEALSFAIAVHEGRVRRFNCDLAAVSR